ncbi:hypothetical protein KH5_01380 [Urechidicola sp. KH5]
MKNSSSASNILKFVAIVCLLFTSINTLQAQEANYTVQGNVSDENGPLPGTSIVLQGSNVGTESDFEGNFEFPRALKEGDVLIFSFLGKETTKIKIKVPASGTIVSINVIMQEDAYNLLGSISKKKVYKSKRKN